jgi:hypothetical protein
MLEASNARRDVEMESVRAAYQPTVLLRFLELDNKLSEFPIVAQF